MTEIEKAVNAKAGEYYIITRPYGEVRYFLVLDKISSSNFPNMLLKLLGISLVGRKIIEDKVYRNHLICSSTFLEKVIDRKIITKLKLRGLM